MKIGLVVLVFPGRAATVAAVTGDGDQATAGKSRVRKSNKKIKGQENQGSDTVLKVKRFPADFLGLQETIGERS